MRRGGWMMKSSCLVATTLMLFAIVALLLGCQKSPDVAQQTASSGAAVTDHKITPAEVGTDAVCPVMKTHFKVTADTLAADYKGKVYYFCCPSCPGAFKAGPEKYVAAK
jgi:YHS domain-containing protein